MIYKPDL